MEEAFTSGHYGHQLWSGLEVGPDDIAIQKYRFSALVPPVLDLAVNLRIDGSATTEMHRDRETKCREEVRGEAQR
jgi:hypothetical protein